MATKWTRKRIITTAATVPAAAMVLAVPFIFDREGYTPVAFLELGKVWSYCYGETTNVIKDKVYTKNECQKLGQSRIAEFMRGVDLLITKDVPPHVLAAHTSFAYNIGLVGYNRSMTLALTNQGDFKAGCNAMMNWYTAGGRDCRIRKNNCYGLIKRREDEVKLCMGDLSVIN